MLEENKSKEKTCLFFASDYHFEMITLPYIKQNLEENKDVVVITENNLERTVEKLLENISLKEEVKENLRNINWSNNNSKKFKEIENANSKNKNVIIFVKGGEEYIKSTNKDIKNLIENENTEIINCYDINEIHDNIKEVIKEYDKILSTSGLEKIL